MPQYKITLQVTKHVFTEDTNWREALETAKKQALEAFQSLTESDIQVLYAEEIASGSVAQR